VIGTGGLIYLPLTLTTPRPPAAHPSKPAPIQVAQLPYCRIQNTVRPAEFLNLQDVGSFGLHLRWIQPLAGYFVAVGLLLTFTGLVGALLLASQSIGVDAVDEGAMRKMQEALIGLLGAATFKFWTSIAGLGSSIILGLAYRFSTWWMQRALDRLCRELERCLAVLTPELIAQRQLEELRQQALQLKEFNGQLAFMSSMCGLVVGHGDLRVSLQ
jgi:hypothetical protein